MTATTRSEATHGRQSVRRLSVARFASSGGSHAAQIALAFTIYEQTHSSLWVSASLVASAGVVGLVGPLSGRLSDRADRRRVMIVAEIGGALGWLLVLLADRPVTLVLFALLATAANAPFKAAASASIPNLVDQDDLSWANGTVATATNASLLLGPLIGGLIVGTAGPSAVYALNVFSFLASAALIARVRGTFVEDGPQDANGSDGRWRTVAADRQRRRLFSVTALTFAAFGVTLVADLPLVDHLGGGAAGYALLTTLWGTGAIVGSSIAARIPVRHELAALTAGSTAMAISVASIALDAQPPLGDRRRGGRRCRQRHRVHPLVLPPAADDAGSRSRDGVRDRRDLRARVLRRRHGHGRRAHRRARRPAHLPRLGPAPRGCRGNGPPPRTHRERPCDGARPGPGAVTGQNGGVLLDGINHVAVLTADTDRLVSFYSEVFDATVDGELHDGAFRLTLLKVGPTSELNVFQIDGNEEAGRQVPMFGRGRLDHMGLQAVDIDAFETIRDRLMARGAADDFVTDFGHVLSVFFTDPDGLEGEVCVANPDAVPGVLNPPGTPAARYVSG